MLLRPSFKLHLDWVSFRFLLLVAAWSTGLIVGLHIASNFCSSYHFHYYAAACEPAGFTGILAVFFLPFLALYLSTRFNLPWLLYIAAFLKAFLFGFDFAMVQLAFGRSAWLIRSFFLFSEATSSILFAYHSFVCLKMKPSERRGYYIAYCVISFILIGIDLFFLSAFFSSIL